MKFWLKEIVRSGVIAEGDDIDIHDYFPSYLLLLLMVSPWAQFCPRAQKILVVDDRWMKVSFFFATN
jgi:hypothetical protein